jgi:hypothetical protein
LIGPQVKLWPGVDVLGIADVEQREVGGFGKTGRGG